MVDRTRPITLNNVSNRIAAAIVADAIMPAVDSVVDARQRGFVRGRTGDDNIHEITNKFYDKLNSQDPHFFLFIDTAKAFDSVDHDYLFAVLNKINMPVWVANIVKGLMTNVSVRPALRGKTKTFIPIRRGVKQGCPLSPLLFLLAYDPLLHRINNIENAIPWSFADDAAIGHPTMHGITQATREIDIFAHISGFGVNRHKSAVLHTLTPTPADHKALKDTKWKGLAFTNKTTYLGVLMGFNIDTSDIYAKALQKYQTRANQLASALSHSSLNNRIIIFNTYLLPLFSYLSRYYILPYHEVGGIARRIASRKIISFYGGAYKYIHLITPLNRFGFARPLRDLWAANVADLASQFDYNSLTLSPNPINGERIAIVPGKEYINDGGREWNGLKPEDHIACAALELVNVHLPHNPDTFDITPLATTNHRNPKKFLRQKIYEIALTAYEDDHHADLQNKLRNLKVLHKRRAKHHIAHGPNIIKKLPPHIRNHQKLITFHALATDARRAKAMHVPPRGPNDNPYPCFLCDTDTDDQRHIYTNCPPVNQARKNISTILGISLSHTAHHHCLANNPSPPHLTNDTDNTKYHQRHTNATIIFNYAVWHTRTHYARTKIGPLDHSHLTNKITDTTLHYWNTHAPPHWRPTNSRTPPDIAILTEGMFGNASTRTPQQTIKAREYTNNIIKNIPKNHYTAYTDGSANLNKNKRDAPRNPNTTRTGPCGAGALLTPPCHASTPSRYLSTAIKDGTNNIGEFYAIGLAIEAFDTDAPPDSHLTILSDSRLATLTIEHNAKTNKNKDLINAIRSIYWRVKHTKNITIHWIPAHIGTLGNETADALAEEGSRRAALPGQGITPADFKKRITARLFHTNPHTPTPNARKRKNPTPSLNPRPTAARTAKKPRRLRQAKLNFTKTPLKSSATQNTHTPQT